MQDIFFYESGSGFPVVFVHGFCESNSIWKDLSLELSKDFKVICPDLPGFGQSPLPNDKFSLEEIGDLLVEWLKNRGIEKSIVIGHSLGGYIALEILRKHPDFAAGIGLFNSSAFEDSREKKENRNKLIDFIGNNDVKPFLKTFVPSLFYPETEEKFRSVIEKIEEEGLTIKPGSVMKYAAAMRERPDSTDLLKQYPSRIMLISGRHDQNVPIQKSEEMAELLGHRHVTFVDDSAHMSLFEQPEICYEAVRNFVRSIIA